MRCTDAAEEIAAAAPIERGELDGEETAAAAMRSAAAGHDYDRAYWAVRRLTFEAARVAAEFFSSTEDATEGVVRAA